MPPTRISKEEIDILDYLSIVNRRLVWFLVPLGLALVATLLFVITRAEEYSATAQVVIDESPAQKAIEGQQNNSAIEERNLANEINFAYGDSVNRTVAGLTEREISIEVIRSDDNEESDVLLFKAKASTANDAAADANLWAQAYISTKRLETSESINKAISSLEVDLIELQKQRESLSQPTGGEQTFQANGETLDLQIADITNKLSDFRLSSELAESGTAQLIKEAQPPENSSTPPLARSLLLAAVIGTILGIISSAVRDHLDTTIKSSADLQNIDIPIVGYIPKASGIPRAELALASMKYSDTKLAEAYQKMTTSIDYLHSRTNSSSVLITSPSPAEGKTTTAINLAWGMSIFQSRVVLVDADFRDPSLHKSFGCTMEPGLTNHISESVPLKHLALRIEGSKNNLIVLPSGTLPSTPAQFVATTDFSKLIEDLSNQANITIFDSPPLLPFADSLTLASQVDATILVAKVGKTKIQELESAISALSQVGANITGICLVGCGNKDAKLNANKYSPKLTQPLASKKLLETTLT